MRGLSNSPLRLVLLGAPGAGKGTQASYLCARLGMPHISTGELLREAQQGDSRLGRIAAAHLARGELVPDEVISAVVEQRVGALGLATGFALDGFPRTIPQADRLQEILQNVGASLSGVLFYDVPEDEVIRRLSGRWMCDGCGRIYNFAGSDHPDRCEVCGKRLYRRTDDAPEAIRNRLRIYAECTAPLIQYYDRRRLLHRVDAVGDKAEIYLRSVRALGLPL